MKKFILLYLTLVSLAFAHNYDDVLLKAQASIFPKIMLLDKKLENKLIDGKIVYTIVYDSSDYLTAIEIKNFINAKYNGHLDKYDYKVNLVNFADLSNDTEASAIYVLNVGDYVNHAAKIAKNKGVISFSYDIDNLKKGLMFSLTIEKSTVLYLEKENLYTNRVDFVDSLLQMVKFIDSNSYTNKVLFNDFYKPNTIYAKMYGSTKSNSTYN